MTEDAGRAIGRREEGMTVKHRLEWLTGGGTLVSIVMIVFGLILLLWPGHTLEVAARVVGIGLLAGGALLGASWYRDRRRARISAVTLAESILAIAVGILLLIMPERVISLVPIIVGVLVALNGLVNLTQSLELRRVSYTRWQWPLVMAILTVLLGVLLVLNPLEPIKWAVMLIGAVLIFNGATNLYIGAKYRKYH